MTNLRIHWINKKFNVSIQSMQSKDDMAVSLMSMTPEAEELLLDRIAGEVRREQMEREQRGAQRDLRLKQRQDIQDERVKVFTFIIFFTFIHGCGRVIYFFKLCKALIG